MKTLEYTGINPSRCKTQYKKIVAAIERDDFKTAEVKKLANLSHGKFYRAMNWRRLLRPSTRDRVCRSILITP